MSADRLGDCGTDETSQDLAETQQPFVPVLENGVLAMTKDQWAEDSGLPPDENEYALQQIERQVGRGEMSAERLKRAKVRVQECEELSDHYRGRLFDILDNARVRFFLGEIAAARKKGKLTKKNDCLPDEARERLAQEVTIAYNKGELNNAQLSQLNAVLELSVIPA